MSLRSMIKRYLASRDVIISRPAGQFYASAIKLAKIKARGLDVKFAVDGGAAEGAWTREFKCVYPQSLILCVEPREEAHSSLLTLKTELSDICLCDYLLGNKSDIVQFNEHADQSSIFPNSRGERFGRVVAHKMARLDDIIQELNLPRPDYIKLDLQGAELLALDGAAQSLCYATAIELEASFLKFQPNAPVIADIFRYMAEHDFACYDILNLWHRELDGALAQGDFLFVRNDSPLRKDSRWSETSSFI